MKLLRATFLSVAGLPDMTCDFSRAPQEVAREISVITGPRSSGKTRILEAILAAKEVIAPYGPPVPTELWLRPGEEAAKIELTFLLDEEEQRHAGGVPRVAHAEALFNPRGTAAEVDDAVAAVIERYAHDPRQGKFDYFPANRGIPAPGPMHGLSAIEQRLYRLGRDARKYSFIPRFLVELGMDPGRHAAFDAALSSLCPTLRYIGPGGADPLRCFSSKGGSPATPGELSTSEAEAVVFAATAALVRHDRSVVFIDRPEQSADERSIVGWLEAVRALAEDSQLVIATTSPALLASVEPGAILHLEA